MDRNPLGDLIEDAADVVGKAPPRPRGWWVLPVSGITTVVFIGLLWAAFGWIGLGGALVFGFGIQLGHKLGTGEWLD